MRTRFCPSTGTGNLLELDRPGSCHGNPALELRADEIETVVDLICRGSHEARGHLTRGMSEPNISRVVRKSMMRAKRALGIPHVQIQGEHEATGLQTSRELPGSLAVQRSFQAPAPSWVAAIHRHCRNGIRTGLAVVSRVSGDACGGWAGHPLRNRNAMWMHSEPWKGCIPSGG